MDLGKISVTPKGAYNSTTIYERLDIVSDNGKSYLSRIDKNNKPLTDLAAWQLLVEGSSIEELSDADIKEKYESNPDTNAFTDAEKVKLASLENFDDSLIQTELDTKVDKVAGKSLSTNDFTDADKVKLASLENFDDSLIQTELDTKVDKVAGKSLSTNDFTDADKVKLASLENFDDSLIQTELDTKVDKVAGFGLSKNNFSDAEKTKLENLQNFDPSGIIQDLGNKVDKIAGKGLSTNDYTTAEKNKLAGLDGNKFLPQFANLSFPVTNPSGGDKVQCVDNFVPYQLLDGKTSTSADTPSTSPTIWKSMGVVNQTITNEALYTDDALAVDILKRLNKATGENVNYRETTTWYDGTAMNDEKVDGVVYIKKNDIYYVDVDFVINKTVRVSKYIPVDGNFHTISSIFPNVTLQEVHEFNSNATLNSSAAWYIMSKLISWIPKYGVINLDCDIQIDHAIVFKRGFFKIISSNLWINEVNYANPYLTRQPFIKQISSNEDVITIVDGDNTLQDAFNVGEVWLKGFKLIGHDYTGDGIAWRQTTGVGQSGNFYMEDMVITRCKTGIKKYGGHQNNLFFTYVTSSSNYDLGLDFPSGSHAQTNYVVMHRCIFDSNGLDTVNGKIVPYTQIEGAYNYDKGGMRISGTSISIYDVALQVNNGLGINIPYYMFGGFITGYAENNKIGDIGTIISNPDSLRNVQINLYSLNKRYYFPFDDVRAVVDFSFASQRTTNLALKEYGRNFIKNPLSPLSGNGWNGVTKEINTDGIGEIVMGNANFQIYYPQLSSYEIPKKGDYYHVSFDLYVYYIGLNRMILSINGTQTLYFSNIPDLPLEEWTRVEHVFYLKSDVPDDSLCFIKQGTGQGYRIKNISVRKLDFSEKNYFKNDIKVMPVQSQSTATDMAGVVADLNALITKLKASNLMAPGI